MTQREVRLLRLAALRTLQHDAAAASLRVANHALHTATAALYREADAAPEVRSAMHQALETSNQEDWLLGNADRTWGTLSFDRCREERDAAELVVAEAAACEVDARRASMQMKSAVDELQRRRDEDTVRSDQRALDEIARNLRDVPDAIGKRRIP